MPTIQCKVCDSGTLSRKKRYRLSGPAVFIGYILLIPSVFGVLFGAVILFASGTVGAAGPAAAKTAMVRELESADVPAPIIEQVVADGELSVRSLSRLSPDQRAAIEQARLNRAAGKVGTGAAAAVGGFLAIFVMVASLCSGLLGWILTMKKRVLQCGSCDAVVQAS